MTDLVTAVVPSCGRLDLLRQAVASIVAQRDVEVEVVVVDDVDHPGTAGVVAGLGAPGQVRVLANPVPRGAGAARNRGVAAARGPWVAFCDDDDLWAPDKLARQLAALRRSGAEWSYGGEVRVSPDLRLIGHVRPDPRGPALLRYRNEVPGGGSGVVAATRLVRATTGFDPDLPNAEDWDLWIRLDRLGPPAVVDHPLVAYRVHPGSKSGRVVTARASWERILRRYDAWPPPPVVARDFDRYLAHKLASAGDRRGAAAVTLKVAVRHRRPSDALRAAALVVGPSVLQRVGLQRGRAAIPADWAAEVERWLAPQRDGDGAPGRATPAPVPSPARR